MGSASEIQLVVQGDDFGMCHAVNAGIEEAFVDGILTQASTMAPCPWVDEALATAARLGIPVGLHQTLTCDWNRLRWGPLTGGDSLVGADGIFPDTVAAAAARADTGEAADELLAQAGRVTATGLRLDYLDVHMGMVAPPAYEMVSARTGVPFLYPGLTTSLRFTSIAMLSAREAGAKKPWLLSRLARLEPGIHLLVCHPGVAGPELASMTSPGTSMYRWAEEYRASDLDVLTDQQVRRAVEDRGIVLTSVGRMAAT